MRCEAGSVLAAEVAKHVLGSRSVFIGPDARMAEADPESPLLVAEMKLEEHSRGCGICRLLYYSQKTEHEEYITVEEALDVLGTSEIELRELISRGKISAMVVGKVLKVSRVDVYSLDRTELDDLYLVPEGR